MEQCGPENTFGAYGNPGEMSFTQEPRSANIFAEFSSNAKSSPRLGNSEVKASYSPSMVLDLRLEIDRLKTQLEDLRDQTEEKNPDIKQAHLQTFMLALEVTRLNAVVAEMAEKTYSLQKCLEEATRAAGVSEREKELERQLDSLLTVNQRNLEEAKYKKLSLEKARKRLESLQAENVLLKMALESTVMSVQFENQKLSSPRNAKLREDYDQLSEKYRMMEKQNMEQAAFAKALDNQVTQMTKYLQECAGRTENYDLLVEENEKLSRKLSQYEEKLHSMQYTGKEKHSLENSMSVHEQNLSKKGHCGYKLMNHLLSEIHTSLTVVDKDSSLYYDCELIRIRIQSLSRTVQTMADFSLTELSDTLKLNFVEREPTIPSEEDVSLEIQALCKVFGQTIESFSKNGKHKQSHRTQSDKKDRYRFDLDMSNTELEDLRRHNNILQEKLDQVTDQRNALEMSKQMLLENMQDQSRLMDSHSKDTQARGHNQASETAATSGRSSVQGNQQAAFARLNEQLAMSNRQCEELSEINMGLRNRIEELERSKDALRDQLTSMHARHENDTDTAAQEYLEKLEDELEKVNQESCLYRTRLVDAEENLKEIHRELNEKRAELAKTRGELVSLQKQGQETSDTDYRKLRQECARLEDALAEVSSNYERLQRDLTSVQNEKTRLIDEVYHTRDEWQAEVKQLKAKIHGLESEIEKKKRNKGFGEGESTSQREPQRASRQRIEEEYQNVQKLVEEVEEREKDKLRREQEANNQLRIEIEELRFKVNSLEKERDISRHSMIKLQNKALDQFSASKQSECGTIEIENMRRFVSEMKVESDYISEGADVVELKQENQRLVDKLSKLQQSTQATGCSDECTREKDDLENEINQLRGELMEIEKTCKHMRDRLIDNDRQKAAKMDELKNKIANLEDENNQLQRNLSGKFSESKLLFYLQRQLQTISQIRRDLDASRQSQREMAKMFVSRISSLKLLFQTEAEIAPRGTLSQIVKLREYNSNGATKMQSTLERVYDQLSATRAEITGLKSKLEKTAMELGEARREAGSLGAEKRELEKKCSKLAEEVGQGKTELKAEREARSNERRQHDLEVIELTRKKDQWEDEKKKELQVQKVMKEAIQEKELEIDGLNKQVDQLSDELKVMQSKIEDSEAKREEIESEFFNLQGELKQRKTQLKTILDNKENIRGSENSLAYRVKELEATVELLTAKLDRKSKEAAQLKDTSDKIKYQADGGKPADRVAIIRSKIELLIEKMAKTVKNIGAAEIMHYSKGSGGRELSPLPGKSFATPLASSFGDDLDTLTHQYDSLGKRYVNDAIDICQKSLKVFEGMQTAHQRLCSKHTHH